MKFESDRAHDYYEKSLPLLPLIHAENRATLVALTEIHPKLLKKSEHHGFDVEEAADCRQKPVAPPTPLIEAKRRVSRFADVKSSRLPRPCRNPPWPHRSYITVALLN